MQTYLVSYHKKGQKSTHTELVRALTLNNIRARLIRDIPWNDLYVGNLSSKGYAPSLTIYQVKNENTHAMADGKVPADIFKDGDDFYWWSYRQKSMATSKKINPKTGALLHNNKYGRRS